MLFIWIFNSARNVHSLVMLVPTLETSWTDLQTVSQWLFTSSSSSSFLQILGRLMQNSSQCREKWSHPACSNIFTLATCPGITLRALNRLGYISNLSIPTSHFLQSSTQDMFFLKLDIWKPGRPEHLQSEVRDKKPKLSCCNTEHTRCIAKLSSLM